MKFSKILVVAMFLAVIISGPAMAAGTARMNEAVDVSANVQNTTNEYLQAAVRMKAFDKVGNAVGHLCQEVTLRPNAVTTVSYIWRAPGYETGLYWSPKVDINSACVYQDADESDHNHGDSDSDDHWYDSDSDDHH